MTSLHDGMNLVAKEFVAAREKLFQRQLACIYFGEEVALGGVLLVLDAGFGLQHAPGLAALYAEHD